MRATVVAHPIMGVVVRVMTTERAVPEVSCGVSDRIIAGLGSTRGAWADFAISTRLGLS